METKQVKAKVVMLPTETQTNLIKSILPNEKVLYYYSDLKQKTDYKDLRGNSIYCHLYFTTDEEIREGDWYIFFNKGTKLDTVRKVDSLLSVLNNYRKHGMIAKIVATTDKSLKVIDYDRNNGGKYQETKYKALPQPSKAFIKKYVEAGDIDEVMIDYITHEIGYCSNCNGGSDLSFKCTCKRGQRLIKLINPKLKVNKHNEIIIHPIKEILFSGIDLMGNQKGSLDDYLLSSPSFSQEDRERIMDAVYDWIQQKTKKDEKI